MTLMILKKSKGLLKNLCLGKEANKRFHMDLYIYQYTFKRLINKPMSNNNSNEDLTKNDSPHSVIFQREMSHLSGTA